MNDQEYLNEVARVIERGFQSSDPRGAMTAAKAGLLVRRAMGLPPSRFGYLKFKDVLQELSNRGLIELTVTSKGALGFRLLPSSPGGAKRTEPREASSAAFPQSLPAERLPRLRNEVWLAYVAKFPPGRRFLNRATGVVRMGLETNPAPTQEWVELAPLDPEAEKAEAVAFLKKQNIQDERLERALASEDSSRAFGVALTEYDRQLAARWNRGRTMRVAKRAQDLCAQHHLNRSILFEEPAVRAGWPAPGAPQRGLKHLLLQSLAAMSLQELLELEIPAKYLVSVLRPDLMLEK